MRDQYAVTDQSNNGSAKKILIRLITGVFSVLLIAGVAFGFSSREVNAAVKKGFTIVTENNKKVCYYYINGTKVKNKWLSVNGKRYYFDSKGHQVIGWLVNSKTKTKRYFHRYLGVKGCLAKGFITDSQGNVRYFDSKTGVMVTGFTNVKGYIRYFKPETGVMAIGSKRIGKYFYYFERAASIAKKGARYQGGWRDVGTTRRYYSKKDGHSVVGWLTLNGKKYRFDYLGALIRNKTFTVDGKKYKADSNGVVTEVAELAYDATYVAQKPFTYTSNGGYLTVYDKTNGRNYKMVNEFATDNGVANGKLTDRDILAALCEAEAGDQGLIGMEAVA